MSNDYSKIPERLSQVKENIVKAAHSVGRDPHSIRLVVVTKGHPLEAVQVAIEAGAFHIGENYAEEGIQKLLACSKYSEVDWHMIGHVQSRKARLVSKYFDCVHSVDSLKLASRLDRFALEEERVLPVLIECNLSGESNKFGFPAWDEKSWKDFLPEIISIVGLKQLRVSGLMTMAPYFSDPEQARPYYKKLLLLGEFLKQETPHSHWIEFSMGMSADYSVAIQEGATLVRVGTAIMGERIYD